jgi:hypothetical protein
MVIMRLISVPDQPVVFFERLECALFQNADFESLRAGFEELPTSMKDVTLVQFKT